MALKTTVGQILVNEVLPEDMRNYNRVMDKKQLSAVMSELAQRYPEKYKDISFKLLQTGRQVNSYTGGNSFDITDILQTDSAREMRKGLSKTIDAMLDDDTVSSDVRRKKIINLLASVRQKDQDDVYNESIKENNPLAIQTLGAGRGNKGTLASIRGSDLMYSDSNRDNVPVPVLHSYSQGLTPTEYWAATYGARSSIIDTKLRTADAGYFGKLLNQLAHREIVTALDREEEPETLRGLPVDTADEDNVGALLAADFGGYKRNTPITPKIMADLQKKKIDRILVRSPAAGYSQDGGVYARDIGMREFGRLPYRGESVGNVSAQALAEPISQGSLDSKHGGGVAGRRNAASGFDAISQLAMVPSTFKGSATHAELDGTVSKIAPAPAGGWIVSVDGTEHYVPLGADLKFKRGDVVEAGDMLSTGVPNPQKITELKGIGEGRRYFIKTFYDTLKENNLKADRRNIEVIARGLINHLKLDDFHGDYSPEDVMTYSEFEEGYEPREGFKRTPTQQAKGMYLEKPYLHYTIGTKVRPSVMKELNEFGVKDVDVHPDPPIFTTKMIPADDNLSYDKDPLTRMLGSGLKKGLLDATHRGLSSQESGTSYVPMRVRAKNFGSKGLFQPPPRD